MVRNDGFLIEFSFWLEKGSLFFVSLDNQLSSGDFDSQDLRSFSDGYFLNSHHLGQFFSFLSYLNVYL